MDLQEKVMPEQLEDKLIIFLFVAESFIQIVYTAFSQ
jgi:hypothetical protein